MASTPPAPKTGTTRTRSTYRHGNLRRALIAAGLELARESGPDAVVLREATRRVGVVPNAAYRHFADRDALLAAVSQSAMARLAATMETEITTATAALAGDDPIAAARARFRAVGHGYLTFAQAEPGLFRAAFTTHADMTQAEDETAAGPAGRTPFQILGDALDDLLDAGLLTEDRRPGAEFLAWSAVHGLAVLLVDGPLRGLTPTQTRTSTDDLLDMIEHGIEQPTDTT
ncbi:TetR/AcrR family transcriptional regulator [Embleya sp. NBC_00896]|uniref:TetR/AcrR family transcriptional regulator n=1 Tax=Embleya sp. NBC_00896 TaxID=2975961 RepID=UPI002F90E139|nr:TetR/AcrR family transcriptional regulator [Embleya sp. NBC_00896]